MPGWNDLLAGTFEARFGAGPHKRLRGKVVARLHPVSVSIFVALRALFNQIHPERMTAGRPSCMHCRLAVWSWCD